MYVTVPFIPSFLDIRERPDGTWPLTFPFAASNVLQTATLAKNDEDVYRFIGGGRVTYNLVTTARQSLRFLGVVGADWFNQKDFIYSPPELQFEPLDGFPGTSVHSSSYSSQANVSGSLVHTFRPASGAFAATSSMGAQYEVADLNIGRTRARGLIGGLSNINRGTATDVEQDRSRTQDAGLFVQEEFLALGERLLLTAGVRADQSSNNSDPNQLFYYPKASASYRLGLRRASGDELKLRVAYGQSGNRPLYGQKFTELSAGNIQGLPATQIQGITADANLRPERQREIEGGLDASLRGGRVGLELTGYDKRVDDLLLQRTLRQSAGFTTAIFNGGTLRVRGIEAALAVAPIQTQRLQWLSRATFSLNRSKLLKLPVPPFNAGADAEAIRLEQGSSITQIYGNDTLPDGSVIYHKIGDQNPAFQVGFSNDITFRRVNLYFLWNWSQGGAVLEDLTPWLFDLGQQSVDYTQPCKGSCLRGETLGEQRLRLWPSRVGGIWGAENATYLKLREVSLTVDLPQSFVKHFWRAAQHARLSLRGKDLLRFTPFRGPDPEVNNGGYGSITHIDITPYPPSRSFWFSVNLDF